MARDRNSISEILETTQRNLEKWTESTDETSYVCPCPICEQGTAEDETGISKLFNEARPLTGNSHQHQRGSHQQGDGTKDRKCVAPSATSSTGPQLLLIDQEVRCTYLRLGAAELLSC